MISVFLAFCMLILNQGMAAPSAVSLGNSTTESISVSTTTEQSESTEFTPKRGRGGSKKIWYYIAGGAFVVLVLGLYIITGGEGYSSR